METAQEVEACGEHRRLIMGNCEETESDFRNIDIARAEV